MGTELIWLMIGSRADFCKHKTGTKNRRVKKLNKEKEKPCQNMFSKSVRRPNIKTLILNFYLRAS
jgi:hypothetical protein